MFEKILLSRYKFTLLPEKEMLLPQYLGSTLRGAFGISFKRIVCCSHDKICETCLLKEKCIYSYVFETAPPADSEKLKNIKSIPRPYIISPPPFDNKAVYSPDNSLVFHLTLIGKAIEYLPYFIVTFQELGREGLKRKYKFTVERVDIENISTGEEEQIYFPTGRVLSKRSVYSLEDAEKEVNEKTYDKLKIKFLSPARIKAKNYLKEPLFRPFFGSLLRRISSLSYFHCNMDLDIDYKGLAEKAETIKISENRCEWRDWDRYSSKQQTRMTLGGFMGEVVYSGNLSPFMPYLISGQWINAGKNPTFGLGQYEITGL